MKKLSIVVFAFLLLLPISVLAINLGGDLTREAAVSAGYSGSTGVTTLSETIGTVVKAMLSLVGVIFIALMVYAGYMWMTARGEEDKVKKAQDIIKSSVIGLIVALGAYSITAFVVPRVLERTTGESGGSGESPIGSPSVNCCKVCEVGGFVSNNCEGRVVNSVSECGAICENSNNPAYGDCEYLGSVPASQCTGIN